MRRVAFGLLLLVAVEVGAQGAIAERRDMGARMVPACQEDEVLIGSGDFVAGRWSSYVCGTAVDDYAPLTLQVTR